MELNIIPTRSAAHIAKEVARQKWLNVLYPEVRTFPNKEVYVRLPEAKQIAPDINVVLHSGDGATSFAMCALLVGIIFSSINLF